MSRHVWDATIADRATTRRPPALLWVLLIAVIATLWLTVICGADFGSGIPADDQPGVRSWTTT